MITPVAQAQAPPAPAGDLSPAAARRRPRAWHSLLPRRTRATLRSALEDAIIVAQDCGDEACERRYLAVLEVLEAPLT
jgi:hypothetical protein